MDANPNFTTVSTVDLEHAITSLSGNINAATYEQLMLIAEFDTRQGWGFEGVRSCAHWLNWRCGVSITTAREKLRVAHALQHLPQTRAAFASGELSYSKARAITRVGTADNEASLLSIARFGSASHLDRTVRLFRKQYVGENGEIVHPLEAERQAAMAQHDHRQLDTRWDESGCLEIRVKLTAEQGALVLKALETMVQSLQDEEPIESTQQNVTRSVENTPAGGYGAYEYGEKQRKKRNRRADALVAMASQSLESLKPKGNSADHFQVVVHVDKQVLSGEQHAKSTGVPDCYIEKQAALPVEVARRLSCTCNIVTAHTNTQPETLQPNAHQPQRTDVLNIGRSTRAISTSLRRALAIRDGQCMFPGCDCNQHLDAHHIVHWANGGETSLHNLMEICHYHHVLLHEGGYIVQREATGELRFYKPDGSILNTTPRPIQSSEPLMPAASTAWYWNGDSMEYDIATYSLAQSTKTTCSPALPMP